MTSSQHVIDTEGQATASYEGPCRTAVQLAFEDGTTEAKRRIDVFQANASKVQPICTLAPNLGSKTSRSGLL